MFNLLRMDLYRLIRSRAVYICLAILLAAIALCYWMLWMIEMPQGREFAEKIGMTALMVLDGEGDLAKDYNTLYMFRDASMDGGAYNCFLGIIIALFVCTDFSSGFAKNIMSLHRNRRNYIGSKLLAAGLLNFFLITLQFGFGLLMNVLFDTLFPFAKLTDTLFYLIGIWLLTTAFAALIILICTVTRSISAGITAVFLLGTGILVTLLSRLTGLFHADGWLPYTLYFNTTYGPSAYGGVHDLKFYAIGLVFLVLYSTTAAVIISRKDI